VRTGREYDAYQKGLDGYESHEKKAIRYFENIYEYEGDEILLDVLYSIAIGSLWVRILNTSYVLLNFSPKFLIVT
jgi:hypothetical protein